MGWHITQTLRFGTYLGSRVTVRYDFGTTGTKKEIYYTWFLFIYFEQTVVKILIINTNTIITLLYYVQNRFCFHCECTQIKAVIYPVIINKTISVSSWFCWKETVEVIARCSTHTHFFIVYIEHSKLLQNVTNMITFPNTHIKHISSSIAKVGRLLYQNLIQTPAHLPLCHATELTYLQSL